MSTNEAKGPDYLNLDEIECYEDCAGFQSNGKTTKELFQKLGIQPYKFVHKSLVHGDITYKVVNQTIQDVHPFSFEACSIGGLYGCISSESYQWFTIRNRSMYYCFIIEIEDDAIVYFETHGKFKMNKMKLTQQCRIKDMPEWQNEDFKIKALDYYYLSSIYLHEPSLQQQLELAVHNKYMDHIDELSKTPLIVQLTAVNANPSLLKELHCQRSEDYETLCLAAVAKDLDNFYHIPKPSLSLIITFFKHYDSRIRQESRNQVFEHFKLHHIVLSDPDIQEILTHGHHQTTEPDINLFMKFMEHDIITNTKVVDHFIMTFPSVIKSIISCRKYSAYQKEWIQLETFQHWCQVALDKSPVWINYILSANMKFNDALLRYIAKQGHLPVVKRLSSSFISIACWEELIQNYPQVFEEYEVIEPTYPVSSERLTDFVNLLVRFPSLVVKFKPDVHFPIDMGIPLISSNVFYYFTLSQNVSEKRYLKMDPDYNLLAKQLIQLKFSQLMKWHDTWVQKQMESEKNEWSLINPYHYSSFLTKMVHHEPHVLSFPFVAMYASLDDWKQGIIQDAALIFHTTDCMTNDMSIELVQLAISQNPKNIQYIQNPSEEIQLQAIPFIQHVAHQSSLTHYVEIKAYQTNLEYQRSLTPTRKRKIQEMIEEIVENHKQNIPLGVIPSPSSSPQMQIETDNEQTERDL